MGSLPFRPQIADGQRLQQLWSLGSDHWVGVGLESVRPVQPGEITRDTVAVGILDRSLSDFDIVREMPGRMTTSTVVSGRPLMHVPSFSPRVATAAWGRCLFLANTSSPDITVIDSEGVARADFVGPGARRPITAEHLTARLESQVELGGGDAAIWERLIADERRPADLPFYHQIVIDSWGRIWISEFAPPAGLGTRWHVLAQDGQLVAEVETPAPMLFLWIGLEGVLATTADELGVESVGLYPFEGGPGPIPDPLHQCPAS